MLAQRLKSSERLDFEQAITELERAVEIAIDVFARGARGANEDAFVNAVFAQAAEKTKNNDLDGAAQAVDNALIELDKQETEQREVVQRKRIIVLEAAIRQHTLRRDAATIAERIERLIATEHVTERPVWHPEFRTRYASYVEDGKANGVNFSLEVAIECARRMVAMACNPYERGTAAGLFGLALGILGERESGTEHLEEAVTAFRTALEECSHVRIPDLWPGMQNNLGLALGTLGERESGTEHLEEAVTAFRTALKECPRAHAPLEWAMTQNNLGNVIRRLGERESGTEHLEEAVIAYRAALEERTRNRVPIDWAATQNNLSIALRELGQRESGTERLEEAIIAFRAALEEHTRDHVPLRWAMTQNNLGNALAMLGKRESSTERLEEAVTAFRFALEEWTRDRVPLQWAKTQNNLENTFRILRKRGM